jgi:hypothetical protein
LRKVQLILGILGTRVYKSAGLLLAIRTGNVMTSTLAPESIDFIPPTEYLELPDWKNEHLI